MALKDWKKSFSSDVTGEEEWRYKAEGADWRIGLRIWKQQPDAYEFSKGEWVVTVVQPGTAFKGVDVKNHYFKNKPLAKKFANFMANQMAEYGVKML